MKKQFFVALHVLNRKQVFVEAAKILTPNGAHGVLLVNNGGHVTCDPSEYPNLFDIAEELKKEYPGYLVGINPLDLHCVTAIRRTINTSLDVLWVDNAGIAELNGFCSLVSGMEEVLPKLKASYYGGVAFKGQPFPKHLKEEVQYAAKRFGQVITSGNRTGEPAALAKIIGMKEMIGDIPLGIASGLSAENIAEYLPYTDIFIVASSLTKSNDFFSYDESKVNEFRLALH